MSIRTFVAVVGVAAAFAAAAVTAGATQSALTVCGTVKASGFTFHVSEAKLAGCAAARALTLRLAHLGLAKSAPRPYPGIYLSMRCFSVARGRLAQIQCTSKDGRKSLYAVAR